MVFEIKQCNASCLYNKDNNTTISHTIPSLPNPEAAWAKRSLAFSARALSLRKRSSSFNSDTSCFAFSRTFIPWSLLSSKYWKSFKVWIAKIFSLHCWATWNKKHYVSMNMLTNQSTNFKNFLLPGAAFTIMPALTQGRQNDAYMPRSLWAKDDGV